MRRLVSDAAHYLVDLVAAIRRGWTNFFFRPADPTPLGLIRIAVGVLGFWSLFVLGLDLHAYLGPRGWADAERVYEGLQPFAWSFWFFVPESMLRIAWFVCLGIFGLLTTGLFSRTASILAWVVIVSTVRRVPMALFGFDQILSTLALYLAVSGASGQAISLDRFFRRWRQSRAAAALPPRPGVSGRLVSPSEPGRPAATVSANLGLRLIQLHLAFIYGMAGLAKLQGPSWWTGTAIWGTMTAGEFVAINFTSLAAWPILLNLLTHASLALEIAYPVLVWFWLTRPLMIVGAIGLHLGIAVVCPGLTEFGLAMITANVAFMSGPWLRSLVAGRGDDQPALRVLFDGACPRCRASMALVTAADPDQVVEPIDLTAVDVATVDPRLKREACLKAMHAVSRSGRITVGFDAVTAVGRRLPLFWIPAFLAGLPGIATLGRLGYNRFAATRPRDVPCTDDVCGLHPPASSPSASEGSTAGGRARDLTRQR